MSTRPPSRTPFAVGVLAVVVLCGVTALFCIQACGDGAGPKVPTPSGSTSSSSAPTPPTPPTNSPPPPT